MKIQPEPINHTFFEEWRVSDIDGVLQHLDALVAVLGPGPTEPNITKEEWAALIGSLVRSELMQGHGRWPDRRAWELESAAWTQTQKAAVRHRVAQARTALKRAGARESTEFEPTDTLLLPANVARRFDMLLGQRRLLVAWIERVEFHDCPPS